jgi:transcription antitermination protein NusB
MGTRRKSREMALQMLFQSDMGKQDAEQVRRTFWAEHGTASTEVRGFADDLFRVAVDRAEVFQSGVGALREWGAG